jgi:GcrA cell cycle regulator
MRGEAWSEDQIDLLKKLWAAGESAQAIAAKLGDMSRSAVLGKVFRLRLKPVANGQPKAARIAKPRSGETMARRRGIEPEPPPAKKNRKGKTLFELNNRCCRWPYRRPGAEHYFFCGAEEADLEAGVPYCARHMKRAYLVPPPRIVASPRRSKTASAA